LPALAALPAEAMLCKALIRAAKTFQTAGTLCEAPMFLYIVFRKGEKPRYFPISMIYSIPTRSHWQVFVQNFLRHHLTILPIFNILLSVKFGGTL
jgi:hypothetical protein